MWSWWDQSLVSARISDTNAVSQSRAWTALHGCCDELAGMLEEVLTSFIYLEDKCFNMSCCLSVGSSPSRDTLPQNGWYLTRKLIMRASSLFRDCKVCSAFEKWVFSMYFKNTLRASLYCFAEGSRGSLSAVLFVLQYFIRYPSKKASNFDLDSNRGVSSVCIEATYLTYKIVNDLLRPSEMTPVTLASTRSESRRALTLDEDFKADSNLSRLSSCLNWACREALWTYRPRMSLFFTTTISWLCCYCWSSRWWPGSDLQVPPSQNIVARFPTETNWNIFLIAMENSTENPSSPQMTIQFARFLETLHKTPNYSTRVCRISAWLLWR